FFLPDCRHATEVAHLGCYTHRHGNVEAGSPPLRRSTRGQGMPENRPLIPEHKAVSADPPKKTADAGRTSGKRRSALAFLPHVKHQAVILDHVTMLFCNIVLQALDVFVDELDD